MSNSTPDLKRISSCFVYMDIGRMFEPDASSISNKTRVSPGLGGTRPGLGRTNLAHFSSALSRVLTPYCVCGRGCPRSECVTAEALSLALVVVSVGDMRGSEESLTGFFFALDACDLEEALGRVVQEPCQVGGFVRPFACEDTGGLIVMT